jgi:signal peptidase I
MREELTLIVAKRGAAGPLLVPDALSYLRQAVGLVHSISLSEWAGGGGNIAAGMRTIVLAATMDDQGTAMPKFRPPIRSICQLTIGSLIVALVMRTWIVMGLIAPVVVSGSSMAPTLLGQHQMFVCRECDHEFAVGIDQLPLGDEAVCPVCGRRRARRPEIAERSGDRLAIARAAFLLRGPRRWEVIVYRCPEGADELCVKRIVGLPGETIALLDGDVYVNGQIARKTLAEQRAVRQSLDGGWTTVEPGRQMEEARSHKDQKTTRQGDRVDSSIPLSDTEKRIAFQHVGEGPVTDASSYNQGAVPPPNRVGDLMLTCESRLSGEGQLVLVAENRYGRVEAILDFGQRRAIARLDNEILGDQPLLLEELAGDRPVMWTLSLFDRQVLLAANDRVILAVPLPMDSFGQKSTDENYTIAEPLAVRIHKLAGEIRGIRAWRDIYYGIRHFDRPDPSLHRSGPSRLQQPSAIWQLGASEFFVIGDNAAVSDDSRSRVPKPGLDARLLIGKPLGVR